MTNDPVERAAEVLRSAVPPWERAGLRQDIMDVYVSTAPRRAPRASSWNWVGVSAAAFVGAAAIGLLCTGVVAPRSNLTHGIAGEASPVNPPTLEARFVQATLEMRVRAMREVLAAAAPTLTTPISRSDALAVASNAGIERETFLRLALARRWETLDPATAVGRYQELLQLDPGGAASSVAAARLQWLGSARPEPNTKNP